MPGRRLSLKAMVPLAALIALALLAGLTLPISAQSAASPSGQTANDFQVELTISGPVQTITADSLVLSGNIVIVIPTGMVLPPGIAPGVTVTVTVIVNDDNFVAVSVVIGTATATPTEAPTEPEFTETPEPTELPTVIPTIAPTGVPTGVPTAVATSLVCGSGNIQPVAERLSLAFHVSYQEIMNWHCMGFGFGEIAKAYALALATANTPNAQTAAQIFALRQSGLGWGQIMHMFKVSPRELAPGLAIRPGGNGNGGPNSEATKDHGHGNGNDNGNGNGNGKGNGGGHDK